jgi:hypothetical protein
MSNRAVILAVLLSLGVFTLGCAPADTPQPTNTTTDDGSAPKDEAATTEDAGSATKEDGSGGH